MLHISKEKDTLTSPLNSSTKLSLWLRGAKLLSQLCYRISKLKCSSGGTAVIVFAREPKAGKVKTRLAATAPLAGISPVSSGAFAAAFYACCLDILFQTLKSQPFPVLPCITPGSSPDYFRRFQTGQATVQQGPDLGARMRHAFMRAFPRYDKLLLIGSDVPHLRTDTVLAAKTALESHDCVLGPALDGGYYLIGFTRNGFCDCFQGIHWSTETVLAQTLERLAGRKTALLESYGDIDTAEDLDALLRSGQCPAALLTFLQEHGYPVEAAQLSLTPLIL